MARPVRRCRDVASTSDRRRTPIRQKPRAASMISRCSASDSNRNVMGRPDWLQPSTSPSRRSRRSRSASTKPSWVPATALSRSPALDASGRLVASRHRLACSPRPMRPRSWCSWLMPNRSASITTITVALGTSTPTSMTVVHTSTSTSPARNAAITASFSSADSRPCISPSRSPASGPLRESREQLDHGDRRRTAAADRPASLSVFVDARGDHVGLAPGRDLLDDALPGPVQPLRLLSDEDRVGGDGLTPAGQLAQRRRLQVAVDRQRHGAGIGVAVITSRCGVMPPIALARNRSRCSTPNRCCSSTTTMPSWRTPRRPAAARACR